MTTTDLAIAQPSREDAIRTVAEWLTPAARQATIKARPPDIVDWAHKHYFIAETGYPIRLQPHQQTFLRWAALAGYPNITYSTVKKSGKTAISGLFSRYRAEFSGNGAEVYFVANDKEQAKDRAYLSALASIELTPGYHKGRRELPGQWRIIERQSTHLPTSSFMRAIAGDYEGAAGGNPTLTSWTELWAFTSERMVRLWDELTPVPTRERSERLVETYAGFVDESKLLWDLFQESVTRARRLSRAELTQHAGSAQDPWPFEDDPPFYVNERAGTFAYWDTGLAAQRRMPWQTSPRGQAFFTAKQATERTDTWKRHWLNEWVSSIQTFIELPWWRACKRPLPVAPIGPKGTPALPEGWPVVMAVDGSVSSDCTAAVGVAREPVWNPATKRWVPSDTDVRLVFAQVWEPRPGAPIDLDDVEAFVRHTAGQHGTIAPKWDNPEAGTRRGTEMAEKWASHPVYNIVEVTYDAYQLHQMMSGLNREHEIYCRPFSQASEREIADKALYDLILRRGIAHQDEFDEQFVVNCAAYEAAANAKNQDRIRIVKRAPDAKIDPVVATSMAASETLRLLLS